MADIEIDHALDWNVEVPDGSGHTECNNNHGIEWVEDQVKRMPPDFLRALPVPALFQVAFQHLVRHPDEYLTKSASG